MSINTFANLWRALDIALIAGFLVVDIFLFHDFLKAGETHTFVEFLVGLLSVVVVSRSIITLKY